MNTVKIGILGTGNIAGQMAGTLSRMEGAELYACASRTQSRAEAFARKYGAARAYASYGALAADEAVDLVYIATPHSTHCENTLICLEQHKAVLCEKPFALNLAQATKMVETAQKNRVLLAEAMWMRYQPLAKRIPQLLASGIIGRPSLLLANKGELNLLGTADMDPDLGGSALMGLGVYSINNAFLAFGGEVESVVSDAALLPSGVDGANALVLKYKGGKMAVLTSSMVCPMDNRWFICGEEGMLEIQGLSRISSIKVYNKHKQLTQEIAAPPMDTGYEYEVQACCDALREGRLECPEMPHSHTLAVMALMDSLRRQWGVRFVSE